MKKLILTSILSGFLFMVSFANPLAKEKTVVAYIDNSMHNHYDKNLALYDEKLISYISTEDIQMTWESAMKECGSFVSIRDMKNETRGDFELTTVTCQFEMKSCVFRFLFDKEGNLKSVVRGETVSN